MNVELNETEPRWVVTETDLFSSDITREQAILRRIKGNIRRELALNSMDIDGPDSVPEEWRAHELAEELKCLLQQQHPRARGGEDLPDLMEGEVEVARMTLANSVHGEVTSLRAQRNPDDNRILFRMDDEYGTEFSLPELDAEQGISVRQVLDLFTEADPSPTDTECEVQFQSWFFPDLDQLANEGGIGVDTGSKNLNT